MQSKNVGIQMDKCLNFQNIMSFPALSRESFLENIR